MSERVGPWERWFAWYPVTLNEERPTSGRVWLRYVERTYVCCFGGCGWHYRALRPPKCPHCQETLYKAILSEQEVEQILGKALGYPWYKDDQKNFPGATEADGVCVGDHVAASLADEMVARYQELRRNSAT